MSERKYTFIVEWFDPSASIVKQFYFTYFVPAQQIEMVALPLLSTILKTTKYSSRRSSTPKLNWTTSLLATSLCATTASLKLWPSGISSPAKN